MEKCGTMYPSERSGIDPEDKTGCLLLKNHSGHHQFICDYSGKTINWEEDESCDCGCHLEEDYPCLLYWEETKIKTLEGK